MWNADGKQQDAKAVIPDRSYAGVYQAVIDFSARPTAPSTRRRWATSPNVGLMAKKAEEYGSHDKTFEIPAAGGHQGRRRGRHTSLLEHVETGDIWRMCQVKDAPIRDWVKLAVNRARASSTPAMFWLDEGAPTSVILEPVDAMRFTLERIRRGEDTISVTGNVLLTRLPDRHQRAHASSRS